MTNVKAQMSRRLTRRPEGIRHKARGPHFLSSGFCLLTTNFYSGSSQRSAVTEIKESRSQKVGDRI